MSLDIGNPPLDPLMHIFYVDSTGSAFGSKEPKTPLVNYAD
jgi:hypothetical protein